MNKISGIYKITNKVTGDFYIGSSTNIEHRWANHKSPSCQKSRPNCLLYQAFQEYGIENFEFEVIEETNKLKQREQYFIDLFRPTYNKNNAKGRSIEKREKRKDKYNSYQKEYMYKWQNRICFYKDEEIKLQTLALHFRKAGIANPYAEAKKYLVSDITN